MVSLSYWGLPGMQSLLYDAIESVLLPWSRKHATAAVRRRLTFTLYGRSITLSPCKCFRYLTSILKLYSD